MDEEIALDSVNRQCMCSILVERDVQSNMLLEVDRIFQEKNEEPLGGDTLYGPVFHRSFGSEVLPE